MRQTLSFQLKKSLHMANVTKTGTGLNCTSAHNCTKPNLHKAKIARVIFLHVSKKIKIKIKNKQKKSTIKEINKKKQKKVTDQGLGVTVVVITIKK